MSRCERCAVATRARAACRARSSRDWSSSVPAVAGRGRFLDRTTRFTGTRRHLHCGHLRRGIPMGSLHGLISWLGAIYLVVPQLMAAPTLLVGTLSSLLHSWLLFLLHLSSGRLGLWTRRLWHRHRRQNHSVGQPRRPQHALLGDRGQGTPEAVPHPEALDPCAPDPGQGTRDRIPETRKPPNGTVPSDTHPSSVGSSQQKDPLASPGGENMDPPRAPNPCHRNVVSLPPPWLGVVEKMAGQRLHDRGRRKHWQTPSPAPRQERKLTTVAPLKPRPLEGVCLTQESQAAQVPETETGATPVVDRQTH